MNTYNHLLTLNYPPSIIADMLLKALLIIVIPMVTLLVLAVIWK